jgi:hypothetical protein
LVKLTLKSPIPTRRRSPKILLAELGLVSGVEQPLALALMLATAGVGLRTPRPLLPIPEQLGTLAHPILEALPSKLMAAAATMMVGKVLVFRRWGRKALRDLARGDGGPAKLKKFEVTWAVCRKVLSVAK